ncbi:hypothetical protein AUEXF2481DRAFT_433771 [Aureobasidium subglaciale EXF-2481]|uniref:Uncharacterized protein n=1 Tax=Aureobasidium subglaciale (strain EXF-2481) TaxID=1043005 RepID=A0A074YZB3_AURSE|nr:uncharacterized protein AUEXF2481DRAFT_433771 [Aureobasidium subglaciale EXF-2481]KEQ92176.1 hypothetical protein AUEXF2481DRAFT_433771 [Aureobasidium subglaciale EXF-2481]
MASCCTSSLARMFLLLLIKLSPLVFFCPLTLNRGSYGKEEDKRGGRIDLLFHCRQSLHFVSSRSELQSRGPNVEILFAVSIFSKILELNSKVRCFDDVEMLL